MSTTLIKREEDEEVLAISKSPTIPTELSRGRSSKLSAPVDDETPHTEDVELCSQDMSLHDTTRQFARTINSRLLWGRSIVSAADRSAELLFGPPLRPRFPFEADSTLATRNFFSVIPKPSNKNSTDPDHLVISRKALVTLQDVVCELSDITEQHGHAVRCMLSDFTDKSMQMQSKVEKLGQSVKEIIGQVTSRLDASHTQNGHSADGEDTSPLLGRGLITTPGSDASRGKKTLNCQIPEIIVPGKLIVGPPVPVTADSTASTILPNVYPSMPRTPFTPGRIGPNNQVKRSHTCVNKRSVHQLDKIMPPANVFIPNLPLTDTEVIVYFFNSLSRPIVSLRLYARNWGPAAITDTLNSHRGCDPPYLRNTCSVKCTTAINKGKAIFEGDKWKDTYSEVFGQAPDCKATDLIRLNPEEEAIASDFDIRELAKQLIKYPNSEDGGLFTRCVKYCAETNAPYTLRNVHFLAMDLTEGKVPEHPPEPDRPAKPSSSRKKSASAKKRVASFDDDIEETENIIRRSSIRTPSKKSRYPSLSSSIMGEDGAETGSDLDTAT